MSIYLETPEDLAKVLHNNADNVHTIKGRQFEIEPMGSLTAQEFTEICSQAFMPAISRLFENMDSVQNLGLTLAEARAGSEPLILLTEALSNQRYSKAAAANVKAFVKEFGVPVDPEKDLVGEYGIYLQLQWIILKENVIDAFLECLSFNSISLPDLKQIVVGQGRDSEELKTQN